MGAGGRFDLAGRFREDENHPRLQSGRVPGATNRCIRDAGIRRNAMKPPSAVRVLLLCSILVAARAGARAEAEVVKEPDYFESLNPTAKPVIEVRGETPYVESGGKLVAAKVSSVKFYAANGPVMVNAKTPPAWVFASGVTAVVRPVLENKDLEGTVFNHELRFLVDLVSPVALDRVFIVVSLSSEKGDNGIYFREIGPLRPYKSKSVQIEKTMRAELGEASVTWHLFVGGREILHSLMDTDTVTRNLNLLVSRARKGVRDAAAEPYLTFPPRGLGKTPGPVTMELSLSREGAVDHAAVTGGGDPKLEKNLLEAVNLWRFLPRMEGGKASSSQVTVAVDLAHWKTWSNDCVHVVAPAAAAAGG